MPTKNQIVQELFESKNFTTCIGKMEPVHLQEDLKMEVIAIVLEWPEERIVKLHELRQLDFFVVRVILNQIQSNTSPFYKKFRTTLEPLDGFGSPDSSKSAVESDEQTGYAWQRKALRYDDPELNPNDSGLTDMQERMMREALEDLAIKFIDRLYWYDAEMVRLYLSEGSFGKMSRKTNIPKDSCYWTVRNAFRKLKRMVEAEKAQPVFTKAETKFIQNGKSS